MLLLSVRMLTQFIEKYVYIMTTDWVSAYTALLNFSSLDLSSKCGFNGGGTLALSWSLNTNDE